MRFTKMHGAGNDYIFIDGFNDPLPVDPSGLARKISDRHFGVGSDGLILIVPSELHAAQMRMFNADGSEAEMCGNGIRCVAKYLRDHELVSSDEFSIQTLAGSMFLRMVEPKTAGDVGQQSASWVQVNMGQPTFDPVLIPTTLAGNPPLQQELHVGDRKFEATCLSMGNPHCVVFVDELTDELVLQVGPQLEQHPAFPQRINVEFARVVSPDRIEARVWERGSGETLACGTGACAVCVAGALTNQSNRQINVELAGGRLNLDWRLSGEVLLTGPAVELFSGCWPETPNWHSDTWK